MSGYPPLLLDQVRPEGARMIEASAGTGKTYTIAGLYLLLVVEEGLAVEQILVMTFTNAATAELRERIRKRLVEARRGFAAGGSEDGFLDAVIKRTPDRELALRRLERALIGFDQAAVFTIHSFCQRALADNAFESGAAFEVELVGDQDELILEVLHDFWRRELCDADPRFVDYLLRELPKLGGNGGRPVSGPEALLRQLRSYLGKPYLRLVAPAVDGDLDGRFAAFLEAWRKVRDCWQREREPVLALLAEHPGINRNSYKKNVISASAEAMDRYVATEPLTVALCPNFERFTYTTLRAKGLKAGAQCPEHELFALCDALQAAAEAWEEALAQQLAAFRVRALRTARAELARLKRRRQVQSFDDLLIDLHTALSGDGGERLARKLAQSYRAALIDEFQDTDPLQYDIFRRVFLRAGVPLFLVGDPKQAIYSFRGADIYAYLAAKRDVPAGYTLGTNYRSDAALVAAVNALFENAPRPFLLDEIPFQPVRANQDQPSPLVEAGRVLPPLRFWCVEPEQGAGGDKPLSKGAARQRVAEAVAAEIARLLSAPDVTLGGRRLEGGDIAVLVRKHHQGDLVVRALQRRGIPCVQQSRANVFESAEAEELERLLLAVLEPSREAWVRAALAGTLLGADSAELLRMSVDENAWSEVLERFLGYHALWRDHGFMRCFRQILRDYGVFERLLAYVDGERRLTNLLHLGELLHTHAAETGLGMEGLLGWLAQQRREPGADETAELRLESDERLVKVVTIHASKGLEYPVVFCPFLWDGADDKEPTPPVAFHDPARDNEAVLDFGPAIDERTVELVRHEALAEDLRLAYVALTRAKHRCYVAWGRCRGLEGSGLGWLLHGRHAAEGEAPLQALVAVCAGRDTAALRGDLEALAARLPEAVAVEPLPAASDGPLRLQREEPPPLAARRFERSLARGWWITSFSALASRGGSAGDEQPDHDAEPGAALAAAGEGIFAFPRGGRPGRCLHSIYQHWDFTSDDEQALAQLCTRMLKRYGFDPGWTEVVADNVRRVLATPLDGRGLRLRDVGRGRRLDELEFHYPVRALEPAALGRLLRAHGFLGEVAVKERIGRLQFGYGRSFMKGYIDLVCEHDGRYYLIDYKSNWLGPTQADYGLTQVAEAMAARDYHLQYLIYTVALHRYLGARLPDYDYERHFGGVYYLFLRGMDPEQGSRSGVFHDRPSRALIEGLDRYLRTGLVGEVSDVV